MTNGVSAYNYWIGANDSTDPTYANFNLIGITSPSAYQVSSRLWAFANYSRYVRPGATRIGVSSSDSNMYTTSFKNTDGSYALVVDNHDGSAVNTSISIPALSSGTATPYVTNDSGGMQQQSAISISNGAFNVSMPPNATTTFTISGTPATGGGNSVTVNDTDSGISYAGNWLHWSPGAGSGYYNDDFHSTLNNGDSASYTFTGTGIAYISSKCTDRGNVDVYVDGNYQTTVNAYASSCIQQQALYSITRLTQGQHTLKLVKKDGQYMVLDALTYV